MLIRNARVLHPRVNPLKQGHFDRFPPVVSRNEPAGVPRIGCAAMASPEGGGEPSENGDGSDRVLPRRRACSHAEMAGVASADDTS